MTNEQLMPQSYRNLLLGFLLCALSLTGNAQTNDARQFRHVVVDREAPDNMHTKSVGDLNGDIAINVGSIFYFQIPPKPDVTPWPRSMITDVAYPEGVGVGDVDRDGDVDICGTVDNKRIAWWENPGNGQNGWPGHAVGAIPDKIADRFYLADLNGDDRLDIVVSAANGSKNGVYWWEQLDGAAGSAWRLRTIVVQDTTNSMDVADMDSDGDIDVISGEHRGDERVAIWVNEGRGQFSEQVVWSGKESHLGTRVADLDGDGDFDIVSIAWDDPQFMHVWRNDAIATSVVKAPRAKK